MRPQLPTAGPPRVPDHHSNRSDDNNSGDDNDNNNSDDDDDDNYGKWQRGLVQRPPRASPPTGTPPRVPDHHN